MVSERSVSSKKSIFRLMYVQSPPPRRSSDRSLWTLEYLGTLIISLDMFDDSQDSSPITAISHLLIVMTELISSTLFTIERVLLSRIFGKLYDDRKTPERILIKFMG